MKALSWLQSVKTAVLTGYSILMVGSMMGMSTQISGESAELGSELIARGHSQPSVVDNLWIIIAAAMVFVMHLGFACLETGLTRAKNTVNVLFKNVAIVGIGILSFAMVGFGLMYPGEAYAGGWFGFGGFGLEPPAGYDPANYAGGAYTYWTDFLFQGMFAATAATIISGAVAERVKLGPFLVFSAIYVAFVYPIVGMWHWGGGWLSAMGFHDFAGSTIVHSVGGWGALSGVIVLGPRIGKYVKGGDDKTIVRPIMGHSLPLATIGVMLLWFGWFGFNGGSVLSADPEALSYVLVTTTLAACAGIFGAMAMSWGIQKEPDLSMILNGILAGLVGITAGADVVGILDSIIIGGIAGSIVVVAVVMLDRVRLDDPVGAISVHLVCGIWGTLAVGIFVPEQSIFTQLIGIGVVGGVCLSVSLLLFWLIHISVGLRVSRTEELRGLDISEHGMEAYTIFQIFTVQ